MDKAIRFGIDQFLENNSGHRKIRWAMVTNDAARTTQGLLSRSALVKDGFQLVKLFSPEHGMNVAGADGIFQGDIRDPMTGLPVISLYGDKMQPTEDDLRDVEGVLFDIPDVGCRFYTYLWTLTHVMESCVQLKKPLFVLDRPNPIGALPHMAEGPMLDESKCSSFIGRWNIPLRHSCTLGELARHFQYSRMPALDLTVVPVANYRRSHFAGQDFSFTPTSPAIRNVQSALMYPGSGLWEGFQMNEGRGTEKPFLQCGAPWMDADSLAKDLNERLHGARAIAVKFIPSESVYSGMHCKGLAFEITEPSVFRAVTSGLLILKMILQRHSSDVYPRLYKTHANPSGERHLDLLLGISSAWERVQDAEPETLIQIQKEWMNPRNYLYD